MTEEILAIDPEAPADRHSPVIGLCAEPGAADWYREQADLDLHPWDAGEPLDATDPDALDRWVTAAAAHLATFGERVHVLATGPAAYAAIVLGVRHPELIMSLLLGDPQMDERLGPGNDGYDELLHQVVAPTLVIASAPDPDGTPTVGDEIRPEMAQAQSIAGGVDNGVFVVIDGCRVPAHRERGSSFNAWVTSFTTIAEGLVALTQQRQEELHA